MTGDDELTFKLGGESYSVTDEQFEALKRGELVALSNWAAPSAYRQAIEEAVEQSGRQIAQVICPHCRHRVVATIVDSARGALFMSEIPNPKGTAVALSWSPERPGRMPPALDLVRVLVEWTKPVEENRTMGCHCPQHRELVLTQEDAMAVVERFRATGGSAKTVRASTVLGP